jgi:hypothetical protein
MPDPWPELDALLRPPPQARVPQGDYPEDRRVKLCPQCGGRAYRDCRGCAGAGVVPKASWER